MQWTVICRFPDYEISIDGVIRWRDDAPRRRRVVRETRARQVRLRLPGRAANGHVVFVTACVGELYECAYGRPMSAHHYARARVARNIMRTIARGVW